MHTTNPNVTTSYAYSDLAEPLQVSFNLPESHQIRIIITARVEEGKGYLGFTLSGANNQSVTDETALHVPGDGIWTKTLVLRDGLHPGRTIMNEKARATSGRLIFAERSFAVNVEKIPQPLLTID